jgi:hypothetical protein
MAQARPHSDQNKKRPGDPLATADGAGAAPPSAGSRPSLFTRLVRVVASFGIVLSVYVAYAMAVVPLIEPSIDKVDVPDGGPAPLPPVPRTDVLAPFFPPGSWELKDPKILESERAMLLIKDYHNLPDGRVKLQPCTVVFFGNDSTRDEMKSPPVILQAPEGAILKFDEPFDLKRAKVGRLIGGSLVGKVTIRREPSRPGATDDLRVTTRDVELTEDRVVTPHPVDFHFGPSYGSGREMTILLTRNPKPADGGPGDEKKGIGITGVKSFELLRDVRMHVLLGGKDPQDLISGEPDEAPPRRNAEPPIEITCQGPFRFNLEKYIATFSDQVDVLRLNTNGPSDQMNCELLSIFFERRAEADAKAKAARAASKPHPHTPTANAVPNVSTPSNASATKSSQSGGAPNLEARLVEARGNPVVVRSPSTGGQARCQRLEYDVKTGRISLQGTGNLQGAMPRNPAQKYQARWSKELRYEPQSSLPEAGARQPAQMISLVGGAHVRIADIGSRGPNGVPQPAALGAEEIHAWLDPAQSGEASPAGPARTNSGRAGQNPASQRSMNQAPAPAVGIGRQGGGDLRPKRLLAQGSVRLDSVPLSGATGRLEVFFVSATAAGGGSASPNGSASPGATNPAQRGAPGQQNPGPQQQFRFAGNQVQVRFNVRGDQTDLRDVLLEGNADLRETKTAKPDEKPLLATGDRLQLAGGDGPNSQVTVVGKPAYVEARGMTLSGASIQLERGSNRLWVDGAGRMTMPVNRDLGGRSQTAEQKLEINWEGRMNFDGHSALFERSIVAHTSQQLLRTERLEVTLKRTIDFSNPPTPNRKSEPAEIDQIVCQGGAFLENRTFDERGLSSIDRLQALDLAINDTTGGIDAHGPGWVSSVRRGVQAPPPSPGSPAAKAAAAKAAAAGADDKDKKPAKDQDKLSYLNVHFARAITGNMHTRELTFADQVKTVYGPVDNWEQQLDSENPEALPPEGVVLTCDQLSVRETSDRMPAEEGKQARGFLELEALGNTLVEGNGFTARAHRLTFAEKKSLLVLEGDGRGDAQLFRQPVPGGPTSQAAARRILYWRSTNRVEIDDARFFDFGQFTAGPNKPAADAKPNLDPNAKPAPKTTTPKRGAPARGGAAATH